MYDLVSTSLVAGMTSWKLGKILSRPTFNQFLYTLSEFDMVNRVQEIALQRAIVEGQKGEERILVVHQKFGQGMCRILRRNSYLPSHPSFSSKHERTQSAKSWECSQLSSDPPTSKCRVGCPISYLGLTVQASHFPGTTLDFADCYVIGVISRYLGPAVSSTGPPPFACNRADCCIISSRSHIYELSCMAWKSGLKRRILHRRYQSTFVGAALYHRQSSDTMCQIFQRSSKNHWWIGEGLLITTKV